MYFHNHPNITLWPAYNSRVRQSQISFNNTEGISEKLKVCFYKSFTIYILLIRYAYYHIALTEKWINIYDNNLFSEWKIIDLSVIKKSLAEGGLLGLLLLSHWYQTEWSYTKRCYAVGDKDLFDDYVWETGNNTAS